MKERNEVIMQNIKENFEYIQKIYPLNLKEIKLEKGVQRRLIDEELPERLNRELNKFLKYNDINVKIKLGPSYNRSLSPWVQLYTDENKKGTKGHYAGLSFESQGKISAWLGFGQTNKTKEEIIETKNQYIKEYSSLTPYLKHGFEYKTVFVDGVIISKVYDLSKFNEKEFYEDMDYLIDLYKKHETAKKFGTLENKSLYEEIENKEEIEEISPDVKVQKGINKLYRGYTAIGKKQKMMEQYLYKKDQKGNVIKDERGNPMVINGSQYEKVVFHPKYTKEEFLYGIEKTSSKYAAGAFYKILKRALDYPKINFYLIIESINKGDLFEIFGDAINLLERREDGRSQFEIQDPVIGTYLFGAAERNKFIYLPSNLFVLAVEDAKGEKTDSYLEDKFEIEWIESTNEELDNYYLKGMKNIKWGELRKIINNEIKANLNKYNTESDKIDSYFLVKNMLTTEKDTEDDLEARKKLTQRLFFHLYEKVCHYNTEMIFNETITDLEDIMQLAKGKNYLEMFNTTVQENLKGEIK